MILSAASDYFAAMFMNNLRESNEKEIEFHEMDGEVLWKLINFCYTGITSRSYYEFVSYKKRVYLPLLGLQGPLTCTKTP